MGEAPSSLGLSSVTEPIIGEDKRVLRTALITGITGQDGSHLTEMLLDRGYEVHGIIRRASTFNTQRIDHLYKDPHDPEARMLLHYGDLTDGSQIARSSEASSPMRSTTSAPSPTLPSRSPSRSTRATSTDWA